MARYEVHRSDSNSKAIIEALRQAGATVEVIDRPLDLLVGKYGQTVVAEVKTARGKLKPGQATFLATWLGHACVLRTVEDGLELLEQLRMRCEAMADSQLFNASDPF